MGNKASLWAGCVTVLIALGGWTAAAAQEAPGEQKQPLVLTLDDAVQMALERNYDLRIADSRTQEAQAAYGEAAAADRLQLTFEGAYLRLGPVTSFEVPTPTGPESIELGSDKMWNYGVSAYQSLYSAGRNRALRALARAGSASAELSEATAQRQIALVTTQLFYGIVQAEGLLRVAAQDEQRAAEQLQIAAVRVRAGAAPQFDQLRAEVEVANAHQAVITAETAVATAKSQLQNLLAIDVADPIEIQAQGEIAPLAPEPYACRELASQTREEIKIAAQQVAMAEHSVRLARAAGGVNLGAIAAYTQQNASGFSEDYAWSVGVQASKPILDGGSSRSQQRQAEEQVKQAHLLGQQTTELVALDVWQAILALDEARAKLASTSKTIEQGEEGLRLAELRYEAGAGTPVEITSARTALTAAETNHVNAIFAYRIAEARLARAVGVAVGKLPVSEQ